MPCVSLSLSLRLSVSLSHCLSVSLSLWGRAREESGEMSAVALPLIAMLLGVGTCTFTVSSHMIQVLVLSPSLSRSLSRSLSLSLPPADY